MEQLKYNVNGIDYLLFSAVCKTRSQAVDMVNRVKKYNGIIQAYDVKEGFWSGTSVTIKMLIPETFAIVFGQSTEN